MESCPTQAVLPLVGLAAEKIIRDRYNVTSRIPSVRRSTCKPAKESWHAECRRRHELERPRVSRQRSRIPPTRSPGLASEPRIPGLQKLLLIVTNYPFEQSIGFFRMFRVAAAARSPRYTVSGCPFG
ncbi:MAG: hypothetical protein R6U98_15280, partial [Pirellulaceae bacterium]